MSKRMTLVLSGCLFLITLQANADVIISHTGSANPDPNEGWTHMATGTGWPGVGVTHLGEAAWKVTDVQGGANASYYTSDAIAAAVFDDPEGWTTSWRLAGENLKTETSDELGVRVPGKPHRALVRYYWDASGKCQWWVWNGWADLHVYDVPQNADRSFAFHDFAISYDPSTGQNKIYLDGSLIDAFTAASGQEGDILQWGGFGGGDFDGRDVFGYWASVKLETGPFTGTAQCGDLNHPYPTGDFTEDCVVAIDDLAFMVSEWLVCTDPACD